ncbi:glucosaminidase domain-containing protein [Succinivibrio sp.]|uniref:glucosaminidase domain-containing protein n=1 Tax=Succinivibrio sp. TaxID=2053619 RepID=UPI003867D42F
MSEDLLIANTAKTDIGFAADHRSLQKLKKLGLGDKKDQALALKAAAEQFEALLNKYWLDAMKQTNETINPDSPLHSKYSSFFDDMLSTQYVGSMNSKTSINKNSVTYLITKQFAKSLGDEGKALMAELDKMSVGQRSKESYVKGSNVSLSNLASLKVDTNASVSRLKDLYGSIKENSDLKNIQNEEDFVKKIMPYALKAVEGIGFNPLVLVAQAALETGWGRHVSDNNNYFGIKANDSYKGENTSELTSEYIDGKKVNVIDKFRKYSGVLESMKDYISFIKDNPRYKDAIDKSYSPDEYFEQIHKAGYATDPNYADKLKKISRKIAFMAYK